MTHQLCQHTFFTLLQLATIAYLNSQSVNLPTAICFSSITTLRRFSINGTQPCLHYRRPESFSSKLAPASSSSDLLETNPAARISHNPASLRSHPRKHPIPIAAISRPDSPDLHRQCIRRRARTHPSFPGPLTHGHLCRLRQTSLHPPRRPFARLIQRLPSRHRFTVLRTAPCPRALAALATPPAPASAILPHRRRRARRYYVRR